MASVIKLDDTLSDVTPPEFESWVTQFEESLSSALDKYAPAQTKMISERIRYLGSQKELRSLNRK